MAERPAVVVDASVVARWYVNNPPFIEAARQVQKDADEGRIALLSPENLLHEVTGVIHQAVFARRLNAQRGTEQLERFLAYDITLIETNDLILPAWELSLRYGCSYYDAIYLEIARRQGCPFIYADGNLRRALSGRFPLEVWIEEYRPA
ncbi:MAG TPA: type II toxin-antitoxin system VapC family toxin [Chloroflexota bacterium]|nr:type II toxin-antitoxin system VapC family toxin [Chloroflexota bacterium]